VRLQVFTVNFRMMIDVTFKNVMVGESLSVTLTDSRGKPLANGVYYIVVYVDGKRLIAKLVVLR
jgi:hypothetical protein